jgi:transcriptional regulator with XRE-family HTH domain
VDNRDEVKAFLSSRRAKITPEQAGLHSYNRNRRVPGLRRSEVADLAGVSVEYYAQLERGNLAGVSVEYYAQLERGNLAGVSDSVLDALARALQLDEAERAHLAELARTAGRAARITRRRTPPARQVRPTVARILDGMTEVPALVNNGRLDVVAANRLARALFAPMFADPSVSASRPANHARFNFLDSHARDFWLNWEATADETVAILRAEAGRDPYDSTDRPGRGAVHSQR